MIEFIDARKSYNGRPAVDGVSFHVAEGNLCVLLGPSGCGKTTLLRMVNRLVEPTSGRILIDGRDVMAEDPVALRRRIGYAIQSVGLFPHRTVAENIATTLDLAGASPARIAGRVDELLAMMKLDPTRYRDRYPAELSGGEAQRVGVARALAADPPLLLMDEPFGAIDPINRAAIREEFQELQHRLRKTILFVSHDIQEAILLADTIALMREGGVEQYGPPAELIASPATPFVERFFGGDRRMLLLESLRALDAVDDVVTRDGRSADIVAHDAPLRDALLSLLGGIDVLRVIGPNDTTLGTVTLDSIQRRIARDTATEEKNG